MRKIQNITSLNMLVVNHVNSTNRYLHGTRRVSKKMLICNLDEQTIYLSKCSTYKS